MKQCYGCKLYFGKLIIHHKDGDSKNNRKDNLFPLCEKCYKIVHYGFHIGFFGYKRDLIHRLSRLREYWLVSTGRKRFETKVEKDNGVLTIDESKLFYPLPNGALVID